MLLFHLKVRPFVKLCNIELGDQESFTQFISIDILWAHGLHIVPPWRKQSMASAFLCGPTVFCRTGSVFATHGRILLLCSPWENCAHNSVHSHKVKRWPRCCLLIYSAHVWTEKADRRGGKGGKGGYLLHSWTPKCHGGGGTLLPWKPSLSNIWFWSAARLWWDPSHLLSALQVTGFSREQIVVIQLWWD